MTAHICEYSGSLLGNHFSTGWPASTHPCNPSSTFVMSVNPWTVHNRSTQQNTSILSPIRPRTETLHRPGREATTHSILDCSPIAAQQNMYTSSKHVNAINPNHTRTGPGQVPREKARIHSTILQCNSEASRQHGLVCAGRSGVCAGKSGACAGRGGALQRQPAFWKPAWTSCHACTPPPALYREGTSPPRGPQTRQSPPDLKRTHERVDRRTHRGGKETSIGGVGGWGQEESRLRHMESTHTRLTPHCALRASAGGCICPVCQ